jgi:predicted ATPase
MTSNDKTTRIVFIGAPGCGKSTVSAELFVALKRMGKNTELVPEWCRRDIMKNGGMEHVLEQYRYMVHNLTEENHFPDNVEYIVQDGGRITGYFYAAYYSKGIDKREKLVIQDLYKDLLDMLYDGYFDRIYFLPRAPVIEAGGIFNDGTRYQTADQADALESYMRTILTDIHKMDSVRVVNGPLDQRVELILNDLGLIDMLDLPATSG